MQAVGKIQGTKSKNFYQSSSPTCIGNLVTASTFAKTNWFFLRIYARTKTFPESCLTKPLSSSDSSVESAWGTPTEAWEAILSM